LTTFLENKSMMEWEQPKKECIPSNQKIVSNGGEDGSFQGIWQSELALFKTAHPYRVQCAIG
jgi:hypothetical protein